MTDFLAQCSICVRGYKVQPEPGTAFQRSDDSAIIMHYQCPDCGVRFKKWYSSSHQSRAAEELSKAQIPYRHRKIRRRK